MRRCIERVATCMVAGTIGLLHAGAGLADPATRLTVTADAVNPVDPRLFGQFLEVASWGEPGPDAVADEQTGDLPEPVVELLDWMRIPVIRWPGGTDISSIDWTDRVDGVPGRGGREDGGPRVPTDVGGNAISNRMSHDAFLRLCERLNAEPMMVLNLRDALDGTRTLDEGARHAAGFVAYCNAAVDADLPEELLDWARLRERNGRREPWGVPYFHVGNELFLYVRQLAAERGYEEPEAQAAWLADHVAAFARAMKAVDPEIELIFDANLGGGPEPTGAFLADPRIRELIDYPTLHSYYPMNDYAMWRGGEAVGPDDVTAEQLWYVWQFGPGHWEDGTLLASAPGWRMAQIEGPLAHTEWNWNGYGGKLAINQRAREAAAASAVAAAAHLNGMIRQGARFKIGNQSMLVGTSWNINAVRVDAEGMRPPFITPTGRVTGLYSRMHGTRRLRVDAASMPTTDAVAGIDVRAYGNVRDPGTPTFPLLDAVATADDDAVVLHLAHRRYAGSTAVEVDLTALGVGDGVADVHTVSPRGDAEMAGRVPLDAVDYAVTEAPVVGGVLAMDLPAGSVVVVRVERAGG